MAETVLVVGSTGNIGLSAVTAALRARVWSTKSAPASSLPSSMFGLAGALLPFCKVAARENEGTNVRINEIYIPYQVENDKDAVAHGVMKSSDFANVYQMLLDSPDARSSRVVVENVDEDLKRPKHHKKN